MNINSAHTLAIDRRLWKSTNGCSFHVEPMQKDDNNPVIIPDRPWEEDVHIYGSVIYADGIYKMWYYARTEGYKVRMTCYAESKDGIHFVKPELDVAEYHGMKTNIVFGTPVIGDGFSESDTVIYTPEDKGREYKMLYVAHYTHDADLLYHAREEYYLKMIRDYESRQEWQLKEKALKQLEKLKNKIGTVSDWGVGLPGVYIAVSHDGIHWCEAENAVDPLLDDISHLLYDSKRDEYCVYGRCFAFDEGRCKADMDLPLFEGYIGRSVFLTRSKDLNHWSESKLVHTADILDQPGDEIYSMLVFPWYDAYIGLVQMYHGDPDQMTLDIQLAYSPDGEHFTRVGDRNPIIPLGEIGEWDRFNTCIDGMPIIEGDSVRFYFNGAVFRHLQVMGSCKYGGADSDKRIVRIGTATCRQDRFASIRASFNGGKLESVPLTFAGQTLHFNVQAAFGEMIVKIIADEHSSEYTITESSTDVCVQLPDWAVSTNTKMSIVLRNARLYSIWTE